jgi:hypothetical protein
VFENTTSFVGFGLNQVAADDLRYCSVFISTLAAFFFSTAGLIGKCEVLATFQIKRAEYSERTTSVR